MNDLNTKAANELFIVYIIQTGLSNAIYFFIPVSFFSLQIKICIVVCITMSTPTTILVLDIRYKGNTNIVGLDIEYKWNITVVIACYSFFPSVPKTAPTKSEPEREKVRTLEIL